ncbi:MAG: hypothetical protein QXD03_03210, partial [Candidatus Anstonellales archaeon]
SIRGIVDLSYVLYPSCISEIIALCIDYEEELSKPEQLEEYYGYESIPTVIRSAMSKKYFDSYRFLYYILSKYGFTNITRNFVNTISMIVNSNIDYEELYKVEDIKNKNYTEDIKKVIVYKMLNGGDVND